MDLKGKLRQGMRIVGADDREYGTVERYDDDYVYVGGRRVPTSAFERMDNDRLYVGQSGAQYFAEGGTTTGRAGSAEGAARVQVHEERLDVDTRQAQLGEVEVRKEVVSEQVSVPVELRREEAHVEQVDVKDRPVGPGEDVFQEGTIRVPIRGEEAVVSKQAYVTGEVVIDKTETTERETVSDTVRKERVQVDEHYNRERAALQQHYQQNRGRSGQRPFEEAEPNYRTGFDAAHEERYRDRDFDAVEPDLRRDWESQRTTAGSGGHDRWEDLREEIREGWNRGRGR